MTNLLTKDAGNRALRSFLTGLAIDLLVGVTLVLVTYFADKNSWGTIEWSILGFSLFKSVVQAGGAFVLRQFLDPSKFPTPLPPAPQPQPYEGRHVRNPFNNRNEGGYAVLGALGLGLIVLSVILLVTTLLKAFVVSIPVLVILFIVGLVLLFLDRRNGSGVV